MNNSEKNEINRLFKYFIIETCIFILIFFCIFMTIVLYPFEKIPYNYFKVAGLIFGLITICSSTFIVNAFILKKKIKMLGKKNLLIKNLGSVTRKEEKSFHNTEYIIYTSEEGSWIEFEDEPSLEEVKQIIDLEFPHVPHLGFYIRLINNKIMVIDYNICLDNIKNSIST